MKSKRTLVYIFFAITIIIDVLIIVESCYSGTKSGNQSKGVTQAIIDFITLIDPTNCVKDNPETAHAVIRKLIGHFLFFGVSGLFNGLSFCFIDGAIENKKKDILAVGLGFGFSIAAISEFIQLLIPGRAGMFVDVLIDFAGFLLFYLIIFFIFFGRYHHKKKIKEAK